MSTASHRQQRVLNMLTSLTNAAMRRIRAAISNLRTHSTHPNHASKYINWCSNIGLMLAATLVALLLAELAFRLLLGYSIVLFPRNHAAAQYGPYTLRRMTPNTVFWHQSIDGAWRFNINNKGF